MLKLFERNYSVIINTSFIYFLLLIINISLLIAEKNLMSTFRSVSLIFYLLFNFVFSMAIIMHHQHLLSLRYSTLSTNHKTNEIQFKTLTFEFFKLSGILLLALLSTSLSTKCVPPKMVWISDYASCFVSALIVLRWSSIEFIKKFLKIVYKMFVFSYSDDFNPNENLVADVWTSFSRPIMMLVKSEYVNIRIAIFW